MCLKCVFIANVSSAFKSKLFYFDQVKVNLYAWWYFCISDAELCTCKRAFRRDQFSVEDVNHNFKKCYASPVSVLKCWRLSAFETVELIQIGIQTITKHLHLRYFEYNFASWQDGPLKKCKWFKMIENNIQLIRLNVKTYWLYWRIIVHEYISSI